MNFVIIRGVTTMELIDAITSKENLNRAYEKVVANKDAGGVDGMKVEELEAYIKENKDKIIQSIRNRTYFPYMQDTVFKYFSCFLIHRTSYNFAGVRPVVKDGEAGRTGIKSCMNKHPIVASWPSFCYTKLISISMQFKDQYR